MCHEPVTRLPVYLETILLNTYQMVYIMWFILGFAIIRLLVALVNYFSDYHPKSNGLQSEPLLSVLIPARNEEQNIGTILDDLLVQDYRNIEVLVYDDLSDDKTAAIVKAKSESDSRIKYFYGKTLPEGWNGKNHACHRLSAEAQGDYMLFVDADVRIGNGLFKNTLSMAKKHRLQLLSIFPKQEMKTFGEKLTVPVMNWILTSLLPLPLVLHSKKPSLAAANGQFMLFEKQHYDHHQWHRHFKSEKVEDIAIMKAIKSKGFLGQTILGDQSIRCRMYSGYREAIDGFSKNVNAYFGNNYLFTTVFLLLTTFGFVPFLISAEYKLLGLYLAAAILIRVFTSLSGKQSVIRNVWMAPLQQLSFAGMVVASITKTLKKSHTWKGRKV
ncbi:MAG TPA: glycosyltransferase [Bacteroidales bacterium]|nr:glycosyltransferase [Bacteroidales bacterium]